MGWRLLNVDNRSPQVYYALREVLIQEINEQQSPNTVVFSPLSTYVLLASKGFLNSVNIEECQRRSIPILREVMNGGVLFYTPSVFDVCIAYDIRGGVYPSSSEMSDRLFMDVVVDVCESFGLEASRSEHRTASNDVVINGRKVSGLDTRLYRSCMVSVAVLTVGFDYDLASKVLKIPSSNFMDKPYNNIDEWVTSLSEELDRDISVVDVKEAFITALKSRYGIALQENKLTDAEEEMLVKLDEKYRSESWLKTGRWSPVKDYGR